MFGFLIQVLIKRLIFVKFVHHYLIFQQAEVLHVNIAVMFAKWKVNIHLWIIIILLPTYIEIKDIESKVIITRSKKNKDKSIVNFTKDEKDFAAKVYNIDIN